MTDTLVLEYRPISGTPDVSVYIDDKLVGHVLKSASIKISAEIIPGFHILKIVSHNDVEIEFVNATLNSATFNQTLYTMYMEVNGKKQQNTTLSNHARELYLPFMNPLSWWLTSCFSKIPPALYGGGLYEQLEVYYPKSLDIGDQYPQIVQDFFKHNWDFYCHPKLTDGYYREDVPYWTIDTKFEYNESVLHAECLYNLPYLETNSGDWLRSTPKVATLEKVEQGSRLCTVMNVSMTVDEYDFEKKFALDKNDFPEVYALLKRLDFDAILHSFIGSLPPRGHIIPHRDSYVGFESVLKQFGGCSQLYIPINFKPGNYFKFGSVGFVPLDQGPILVNNHNFVHSVINDSDEWRFALAIVGTRIKC